MERRCYSDIIQGSQERKSRGYSRTAKKQSVCSDCQKRRHYKRSHPGYAKEKSNGRIWISNTNGSLGNQQEGNRNKRAAANGCYQKECSQAVYSFT